MEWNEVASCPIRKSAASATAVDRTAQGEVPRGVRGELNIYDTVSRARREWKSSTCSPCSGLAGEREKWFGSLFSTICYIA
jgi:hypothetical protein